MLTLSDLLSSAEINTEDSSSWPVDGANYRVEILVAGHEDDPEISIVGEIPAALTELLSETGPSVTDDLFDMDLVPQALGRYMTTLRFVEESHYEWESGNTEYDCYFVILACEKISTDTPATAS